MKKNSVELGDRARDSVTGYTGIAVGSSRWLHGCERITLQAPVNKDGSIPDAVTFDAPQLECLKAGVVATTRSGGGPGKTPARHAQPQYRHEGRL
jgi:hypothetical protein